MDDARERLAAGRPILLDGPMGTELARRGHDTSLPLWSARSLIRAPDAVLQIHRDHLAAGAEILTSNSFRTHRRSLAKAGLEARAGELTRRAVDLARAAIESGVPGSRPVFVAGSISPLEDCYSPGLTPGATALEREHSAMAADLAGAGVDLFLVETMPTVREAVVATRVAVAAGRLTLTGFTCSAAGALLSGETVEEAAAAVADAGAAGVLINCTAAQTLAVPLARLAAATSLPIGAYGNVGHAESSQGWASTDVLDPDRYVDYARRWLRLGARIVGGCCGTTVGHLSALRRLLDGEHEESRG